MHKGTDSTCVGHEPCPKCGSSDNLARYNDGHAYCFGIGCEYYEQGNGTFTKREHTRSLNMDLITDGVYADLTKRGISEDTCRHFGYTKGKYKDRPCQIANYHDAAGLLVAQKLRFAPDANGKKQFMITGDINKASFFGSQLFGKGKMIVITEGEIDALSVAQIQDCKWPVVSIPTGAAGAKKSIVKNLEYLANFEQVVLMFDNDETGQLAAAECAEALGPNRCKIATLPLKDANEMLMANRSGEVIQAMWNARPYRPEGVKAGADLFELVMTKDNSSSAIPYPWNALNEKTYGLRTNEIVLFTAGSGVGKSAIVREIGYYLAQEHNQNVGWIMLEENTRRTALGIMSLHKSLPLHIPKYRETVDDAEMQRLFAETLGTGRHFMLDRKGDSDVDTLCNRIRYLVVGLGCRWVILDHISIIVSGMEDGDERRLIDNIMTRLANLVEELPFGLIMVCHLKRPSGTGHENGAETSLSQLRGSHALAQLSHMVIGTERDQQGDMSHVSTVRVLKNRFSGDTGVGCYLAYEREQGRLYETDPAFIEQKDQTPTEGGQDF